MGYPKGIPPPPPWGGGGGSHYRAKLVGTVRAMLLLSDVVNVFCEPIPCCFDFIELCGNHVEPCVGFDDLRGGQDDHVAQVALGADDGEVVCHGVKIG